MQAYITRFRVQQTGTGTTFPVDMLRYDSCYPADQAAVGNMFGKEKGRYVDLIRIHNGRPPAGYELTPDRWVSFSWRVVHQNTRKL